MDLPSVPDQPHTWWEALIGIVWALGFGGLWAFLFKGKERAAASPVPEFEIARAEIVDMGPARELVRTLGPKMERVFQTTDQLVAASMVRDERQKEMNRDIEEIARKMDQVIELLRQATEERRIAVARQDERDKWHRPAE